MGSLPYVPYPHDDTKGGACPPLDSPAYLFTCPVDCGYSRQLRDLDDRHLNVFHLFLLYIQQNALFIFSHIQLICLLKIDLLRLLQRINEPLPHIFHNFLLGSPQIASIISFCFKWKYNF